MIKAIKNSFFKIAERYAKNRFTDVEVHENPFAFNIKSSKK